MSELKLQKGTRFVNHKTVIELNGKQYDALTGKTIGSGQNRTSKKAIQRPKTMTAKSSGQNVDGFFGGHGSHNARTSTKPKTMTAKRQSKPIHHHEPEHTKTLARFVVKKPVAIVSSAVAATTPTILLEQVRKDRLVRAQKISKSRYIGRFGAANPNRLLRKTMHLPVQPPPEAPLAAPVMPLPHTAMSATVTTPSTSRLMAALEKATSHEQQPIKKQRLHQRLSKRTGISTKILSVSAVLLLVLGLGGLYAYEKVPSLALRVAATRAGFHASLPNYKPAGFSMAGPIQYSPGEVTLSFKSTIDERNYQVKQQPSTWTSETLLNTVVGSTKQPYQTYQDSGRTIYIYNGTEATSVSGGVVTTVKGDSKLSADQLVKIIKSINE